MNYNHFYDTPPPPEKVNKFLIKIYITNFSFIIDFLKFEDYYSYYFNLKKLNYKKYV